MTSRRTRMRLIERLRQEGIVNEEVLGVMAEVPRHIFVDEALAHRAYENTALPIGHSQTISQPYIVARMTELLCGGNALESVLEVGTGSGYQGAILAHLAKQVYTVERIDPLLDRARKRYAALKLNNIHTKLADGHWGWPEKGPFDAIMVTAAPDKLPEELLGQLKEGGRLVIPIGEDGKQYLSVITRRGNECEEELVEAVRFVPLLGGVVR
ncbi:protein-L-isoaspartate(D-aspartate) O-methyltransferase [Hahella ganghwensis]|uniref:protein-L-isoaspartate(D-aspartate) O-methyltransferase n=1 Tax=Hahella ganghwensis TaxID=286420 RepID=UPI000372FD4F|nr:protein-L-isoaspartate(D-aspartate) O-methyltransferase [Hahella ganghwensis]